MERQALENFIKRCVLEAPENTVTAETAADAADIGSPIYDEPVICIGSAFLPIQNLMYNLIVSKGRSDICLRVTIAYGVLQLAVGLICSRFGVREMVCAYTVVNVLWVVVWWSFVRRLIRLGFWRTLSDIVPFCLVAAVSMLVAAAVASLLHGDWLVLTAKIVVAAACYVLSLYLLRAQVLRECITQLKAILQKKRAG